jgi:hypothetical protein
MWTSSIEKTEGLRAIYQENIPDLENLLLHEIKIITGQDLIINVRFDLKELPGEMPKKWLDKKVNTVQITLALVQAKIEAMDFSRSISSIENITIELVNGFTQITFLDASKSKILTIRSTWIYLSSLAGYQKELFCK